MLRSLTKGVELIKRAIRYVLRTGREQGFLSVIFGITGSIALHGKESERARIDAIRDIFKLNRIRLENRIVDIGCGSNMSYDYDETSEVIGIDIDRASISNATKRFQHSFIVASAEKLPLKTTSINTIFCCENLEHLENPVEAIKEIHRILADNGIIIVTTPWLWELVVEPLMLMINPLLDCILYRKFGSFIRFEKNKASSSILPCSLCRRIESFVNRHIQLREIGFAHRSWHPLWFWKRALRINGFDVLYEYYIPLKPIYPRIKLVKNKLLGLFCGNTYILVGEPSPKSTA